MTKVYIRMDPLLDQRKAHYSTQQLGAFVRVLLLLGRGSHPGRFPGDAAALKRALPADAAKHVGFLLEQGDIVVEGRGDRIYFDGWDEWQEGDLTVNDRQAKLRARQSRKAREHREKRENYDQSTVTKAAETGPDVTVGTVTKGPKCHGSTSTPTSTVPYRSPLREGEGAPAGADRSRKEGSGGSGPGWPLGFEEAGRAWSADPIAAILVSTGAFTKAPGVRAALVRAWGGTVEDVEALVAHAAMVSEVPLRMLRWMLRGPGEFKVALGKLPPRVSPVSDLVAGLAGRLRSAS
jgi:hypothetical protein